MAQTNDFVQVRRVGIIRRNVRELNHDVHSVRSTIEHDYVPEESRIVALQGKGGGPRQHL